MVASKEKKRKKRDTYIQKHTTNKNGSEINRNKEQKICTICTTGCYNMGLFIAMETLKSLPLAELSQTSHQPQDRSTIYRIGSVNLTISVQILQHVFPSYTR